MKITIVLGYLNPFPGAAWTRIGFFARHWVDMGEKVEVLGTFSPKSFWKKGSKCVDRINISNFIFNIDLERTNPLIFIFNSLMAVLVSTLILIATRPHVTIVSVPTGEVGLGAIVASKLVGIRCVVDYRDEWEDYAISLIESRIGKSFYTAVKKLMASLYAKCHLVVTVTPKGIMSLKRRGLIIVRLVPNGADTGVFKPSSEKKEKQSFTLFYSGTVGGYYRLDVAVKAIKELVSNGLRNIKLVIAGKGEIDRVLYLASELGISSNIEYRGLVRENTKLADLMAQSDLGLIPYDHNPLWKNAYPTKFFEYCASGIPAIATIHEDAILSKLISSKKIGLVSPPLDVKRLAANIKKMYFDEPFRRAAGQRARNLVETEFDRNVSAKRLLSLLDTLKNRGESNKRND